MHAAPAKSGGAAINEARVVRAEPPPRPGESAGKIPAGKTAIIAGSGALPLAVAERLQAAGAPFYVILLRGNADAALRVYPHCELGLTDLAALLRRLKAEQIDNLVLAGGVARRPNLGDLRWSWPLLKALPQIITAIKRGDDSLLRAFIRIMEGYGYQIIGAHEIVPELLTQSRAPQLKTRRRPNKAERADIDLAARAARLLGELDVGQGAVAAGGRVVALEGAEGTDAMLERVAALRAEGKIPPKGGALVKMKKPNQEMRADLPAIGPQTIANIAKAGLSGLAVESGGSFILAAGETVAEADKLGLFIATL